MHVYQFEGDPRLHSTWPISKDDTVYLCIITSLYEQTKKDAKKAYLKSFKMCWFFFHCPRKVGSYLLSLDLIFVADLQESMAQNFSTRYLNMFTRATCLSPTVTLSMSPGEPLVNVFTITFN